MDIVNAIMLVILIILVLNWKTSLGEQLQELEERIKSLQATLLDLTREKVVPKPPAPTFVPPPKPVAEIPKPPEIRPEIQAEAPRPLPVEPTAMEWHAEVIADSTSTINKPIKPYYDTNYPSYQQPEPEPSFFERYPDLEKFIGENLAMKIGIAFVVLSIGFFVKYAIDANWIGPVGRVAIGILCGAILIGIAHWMRNTYKAFSSVLAGGGLAVFYFTITLAFHQFHLFDQTTAFIILIAITIFAVVLALLYDKQELAVIALIGGLSSPFMVSNGSANYNALFIYLVILNAGLLVLAYYKAWRILNISTFVLTVLVFGTVMYTLTNASYHIGFIYAGLFYLLFFAINIANNLREGKSFVASDFGILLANTALYFSTGLYLLTMMHCEEYRGLFCAGLGVLNLALSYLLFRNKRIDVNVLYLLIGITLTLTSLTAPIQLHGHNITLFWASEAVLLYWLYQKSGIVLIKLTSMIVSILMLISLGMDWVNIYSSPENVLPVLANKGFVTTFYAAICSWLLYYFIGKNTDEQSSQFPAPPRGVFLVVALALLFLSGLLEINHQFLNHFPATGLNVVYMLLYVPAFVWLFNLITQKLGSLAYRLDVASGLLIASICVFIACTPQFFEVLRLMLEQGRPALAHFTAQWLGAVITLVLFYQLINLVRQNFAQTMPDFATWLLCAGVVLFLSLEVCMLSNMLFYDARHPIDDLQTIYIKTGLPVLWGLCSFSMMWLGMRYKERLLRVISLSLFTLTLAKLFIFDIRDIPAAGKIAAFFCLGVLLLVVSFMYQKVKKIITADEKEDES